MNDSLAAHSHHKPESICIVCSINALADTHDFLIEIQSEIDDRYHDYYFKGANQNHEGWHILSSSANQSINFLLTKIMDDSSASFEAYTSIARNLIEKLSKLRDVFDSRDSAYKSTQEFDSTTYDAIMMFESFNPLGDSKKLKREKFLNKGANISNISEDKYQLIFTYLSRVIHSYNKDVLLGDKMTRFMIKSYLMVAVCILYHQTMLENGDVNTNIQRLHSITVSAIEQIWSTRGATQETLIYWTTFYETSRKNEENQLLDDYREYLNKALNYYKMKGLSLVPTFELSS